MLATGGTEILQKCIWGKKSNQMNEQVISYTRTTGPSRCGTLMELESSPERVAF